jgi:hypothetical protein
MENSGKVNKSTANQKLNGDVNFVLRCSHRPEMEFCHSLTNEIREELQSGRVYGRSIYSQLV